MGSEFITFPIKLYKKTTETVEIEYEEEEDDESATTEGEDGDIEVSEEEEGAPDDQPKTEQVTTWDWHHVNNNVAIWSRDSSEVSDEEYKKFYTSLSQDSTGASSTFPMIHSAFTTTTQTSKLACVYTCARCLFKKTSTSSCPST